MKRLCYGIAGMLCASVIAGAQSTTQLEQQWQELKQQYGEATRAMEQRISALEQQIETQREAAATPKEGTISSLGPSSAAAGGQGVTLTVNGSGFASGAVVDWTGSALSRP